VAIRKHSRGKQSLDDVLRALRAQSLTSSLTEEEALTALEAASGGPELGALLREKRALPVEKLLRQLGVEPTGDSSVRLREDAPLSALRRAMF
jgi:predicted metalloprotease with PDZ domain